MQPLHIHANFKQMGTVEPMRRELEVRQLEYGAATARAQDHLDQLNDITDALRRLTHHLEVDSVNDTVVQGMRVMTAHREELDESIRALASAAHRRGVPYRRLADAMGVAPNTVRQWITEYREQYEGQPETHPDQSELK